VPIYADDSDRIEFPDILADVVHRFGRPCHAYCLMTNHYHLLVETPDPNLSRGVRELNGLYTQGFNRRNGRVGHGWQGRFKAGYGEPSAGVRSFLGAFERNNRDPRRAPAPR